MTLVVARCNEGRIHMVGDTKFTPRTLDGRVGQRHFIGGLKIVILHPGAVIAFAGNIYNAQQAIVGIHSRGVNLFDKNAVLDYLLDRHVRSQKQGDDQDIEFIAAFELDNRTSELFLIKRGKVERIERGYIGDLDAYNCFLHQEQRLVDTLPTLPPLSVAMESLRAVIHDPNPAYQSVDGFAVGVRQSVDEGFVYVQHVTVEGQPVPISYGHVAPVTFGGAPAGANEWSIGSSPGDRYGVLTAFCHTGSFGVIYCPALDFNPRIVQNCTPAELVNESMLEVNQILGLLNQL